MVVRSIDRQQTGSVMVEFPMVIIFCLAIFFVAIELTRLLHTFRITSFVSRETAHGSSVECGNHTTNLGAQDCILRKLRRFRNAATSMFTDDFEIIVSSYRCVSSSPPCAPANVTHIASCRVFRTNGVPGEDTCVSGLGGPPFGLSKYSRTLFQTDPLLFAGLRDQQRLMVAEVRGQFRAQFFGFMGIAGPVGDRTLHEVTIF